MKVSKRQLRKIIREERSRLLSEQGGWNKRVDTGSDIITFAKAYAGLGNAVQEQVDQVIGAYFNSGGPESDEFYDAVHAQNPNAIDMAYNTLGSVLGIMDGDDALGIQEALQAAWLLSN